MDRVEGDPGQTGGFLQTTTTENEAEPGRRRRNQGKKERTWKSRVEDVVWMTGWRQILSEGCRLGNDLINPVGVEKGISRQEGGVR